MKKTLITLCLFSLCACRSFDGEYLRYVEITGEEKLPTLESVYIDATLSTPQYWKPGERVVQQGGLLANIFYEEVEKNLTDPSRPLKGYIELRNNTYLESNGAWAILSGLTLCTLNLLGMPIASYTATSEINIRILDKQGGLIKRYRTVSKSDTEYIALYWGYAETRENGRNFQLKVYREALSEALEEIRNDRDFIISKLK